MNLIFKKALHDSRRSLFWMAIGLGLYALMIMAFYPTVIEQSEEFDELIQNYPEEMMGMFYGGDPADLTISEPGTYIGIEFATWALLILSAMTIAQAFNAFTNAERDGTLDLVLCLPITRRQLLVGRALFTAFYAGMVLLACLGIFLLSMVIWPEFDPNVVRLALGILGNLLPVMVVAAFAYMLVTLIPSSKRYAGGLAYLFMIGSYLVHSFAGLIDQLEWVRPLLYWNYFDTALTIRDGAPWGDWLVLVAMSAVFFAVAYWAVDRKEMGV